MTLAASASQTDRENWKKLTDTSAIDWRQFDVELDRPMQVTPAQQMQFRDQGFIKLKHVLSPALLKAYGDEITNQVIKLNEENRPMAERTTYGKAFLQIMNIWRRSDIVGRFVKSRRLASIAGQLMGVRGIRLYHDQALYKEPGGGITPWHADQYYWPLDTYNTITAWIPLQETPMELGPLAFSATSHRVKIGRDLEISDDSEVKISKALLETGLPLIETPFELGEISYHYGWTFHRAAGNNSDRPRKVITMIYMEDGVKVATPQNKGQTSDLKNWLPGLAPGDIARSPLNPLLWSEQYA